MPEMTPPPLSEDEIKKLRDMLESQERAEWLWSTLRIWASYISGAVVAVYAVYEVVLKVVKGGP